MSTVGKILVIVNMIFALLFLGFSTVVFTTAENWKDKSAELQKQVGEVRSELQRKQEEVTKLATDLEAEKKSSESAIAELNRQVDTHKAEIDRRTDEITQQRTAVETAQQNVRAAQSQAEAYFDQTKGLRTRLAEVEKQANEFKLQQTELNEQIRVLQRELEVAKTNNEQLRERNVVLTNVIAQNGLDPDPSRYKALQLPPEVDGEITRVGNQNRRFEISIGEDDGIVPGHELYVYRFSPTPEFLGRVKVQTVEPEKAVVTVIGSTPLGKTIREGDIVSTKIRPRH